jgi:hypothetical protein
MKRILIGSCAALACAVSLAAQTPASPPQDPPKPTAPSASSSSAEKSVTLKGCLRAGEQPDAFVLANASTPTETAGTTGTTAAPAMKNQTVRLIGAPTGISLKDHVGHTVEVTGMIAPQGARPSAGATPPAGATPAPGAAATTGSADTRLNVKNVKHVDAKCGAE